MSAAGGTTDAGPLAGVPLLFGEVLYDCFEDGARVLGGAPFNVAWHLQALGARPVLVSRVGDDPMGREIRDTMQRWGMSGAGLQKDSAHPTGEVRVTLKEGQPSFEILPGRAYDHIEAHALPPGTPALVYHGSLALRSPVSAATLAALLRERPAPVFLDVNLRPPWWERGRLEGLLDGATWVKINDQELETLVPEGRGLEQRAQRLIEAHGLRMAIVTRGAAGAFARRDDGGQLEVTPRGGTPVVDTVGAGDAFAAVCILGLLRGWPLGETLERAQHLASLLVGRRGATVEDPAFYAPLLGRWGLQGA